VSRRNIPTNIYYILLLHRCKFSYLSPIKFCPFTAPSLSIFCGTYVVPLPESLSSLSHPDHPVRSHMHGPAHPKLNVNIQIIHTQRTPSHSKPWEDRRGSSKGGVASEHRTEQEDTRSHGAAWCGDSILSRFNAKPLTHLGLRLTKRVQSLDSRFEAGPLQ
jgi:hypothetical protein